MYSITTQSSPSRYGFISSDDREEYKLQEDIQFGEINNLEKRNKNNFIYNKDEKFKRKYKPQSAMATATNRFWNGKIMFKF